ALSGPRWPDPDSGYRLPTEGIAVALVLDVSPSMGQPDFVWQPGEPRIARLEAAKRSLRLFVAGGAGPDGTTFEGRPTDLVGLVTFAMWPKPVCPLTLSHSVLLQMLDEQEPAEGLNQGTNVGDAIAQGVLQLGAAPGQRKVMVLFSDGEHNFDLTEPRTPLRPRQAAQLAAARGVKIYAIDTGGEPVPPSDPDDSAARDAFEQRTAGREVLRSVAEMTGGRTFVANDGAQMREVMKEIDSLEREDILSFRYRRYHELAPGLALAALALAAGGWLLERTRWRRLP
ncbi:MAG TPA: VWA domain-containing protein, partial [Gemmataceae bacterium]